jgi:hypothetical protein
MKMVGEGLRGDEGGGRGLGESRIKKKEGKK